jgi:hypothetical protein
MQQNGWTMTFVTECHGEVVRATGKIFMRKVYLSCRPAGYEPFMIAAIRSSVPSAVV